MQITAYLKNNIHMQYLLELLVMLFNTFTN